MTMILGVLAMILMFVFMITLTAVLMGIAAIKVAFDAAMERIEGKRKVNGNERY